MYVRYGRRSDKQHIAEHYRLHDLGEVTLEPAPDWNITPDSMQPVTPLSKDTCKRELAFLKWRLVPFWSETPKPTFESINARAATLLTSGSWREPFQRRRCLIPGEFFYEWEPIDKKTKQPYAVALTDDRLFSFGGIWDRWKDHDTGQVIESFAMITCDPNKTMETFHDRTPLIVDPKDFDRWLADAEPSQVPIDLVRTYPADEMKAWKIAKLNGNGPHLLDPLPEPPQAPLTLFWHHCTPTRAGANVRRRRPLGSYLSRSDVHLVDRQREAFIAFACKRSLMLRLYHHRRNGAIPASSTSDAPGDEHAYSDRQQ